MWWYEGCRNINGKMHDSRKGFPACLYRKKERNFNPGKQSSDFRQIKPVVHKSVLQRKLNKNNKRDASYSPWILNQEYDVESWPQDFSKATYENFWFNMGPVYLPKGVQHKIVAFKYNRNNQLFPVKISLTHWNYKMHSFFKNLAGSEPAFSAF